MSGPALTARFRPLPRFTVALARVSLAVALVSSGAAACSRDRDPQPREQDERTDARLLDDVLAADQALEAALREVDARSRNDEKGAADLIETRAMPLADRVVERARAAAPTSSWGRDRRSDLLKVAEDRRTELPRYARALREADLKAKLAAFEAQLDLQRRAMQAAARVSQTPTQ